MDKEQQKKLLTEVMNADAKDGLYKQQTAVEWLVEQLDEQVYRIDHKDNRINISISFEDMMALKKQAKQMEKEQIEECWNVAHQAGRFEGKGIAEENWQTFKQYYNETYKKD